MKDKVIDIIATIGGIFTVLAAAVGIASVTKEWSAKLGMTSNVLIGLVFAFCIWSMYHCIKGMKED